MAHKHSRVFSSRQSKFLPLLILLILLIAVGGTIAYLITQTQPVVNTFTPVPVDCEVTEEFDGTVKKNVNVRNTSETDAFLRVKLISYRVNDQGQRIGGVALVPDFVMGTDWFKVGDCYYYANPVAPGKEPASDLIGAGGITLVSYTDADGGKQVIEVMAEAVQAKGFDGQGNAPVSQVWPDVTVKNGVLAPK